MPPTRATPSTDHDRDTLLRVLAVARALGTASDLNPILSTIIDAMRDLLSADRATVFQYLPDEKTLFSSVAHGLDPAAGLTSIRVPLSVGIAGQCAASRSIINIPDAYADKRFNPEVDKKTGFRTRSILAIPLLDDSDELIGVAQVLNKRAPAHAFTPDDEAIATALAAQAAVALKRAQLLQDRIVREQLERDLELARLIQQESFPKYLPSLPGYDIAGFSLPADQTGGDAYDIVGFSASPNITVSSSNSDPCSHALFFLADATGHGVGPAISVTQARSMLRMGLRAGASLLDILTHVNHQLSQDLPAGRFITAYVASLSLADDTLTSLSAGQAPILHYHHPSKRIHSTPADTLPLGITDTFDAVPNELTLAPGDIVAILSDGFYEAASPTSELFGEERITDLIRQHHALPAAELLQTLHAAVTEHAHHAPPADDQTAILIKRR